VAIGQKWVLCKGLRVQEDKMSNTTDMNIVLGQGSAVKHIYNFRRHNQEVDQELAAQIIENKKQKKKEKIKKSETDNKVKVDSDQNKKDKKKWEKHKKDSENKEYKKNTIKKSDAKKDIDSLEGSFIDIKV
jgi:hypothetical protein